MRTKKTFINMCAKFVNQIVVILLGLISRRVMIDSVGVQYLGINGVLGKCVYNNFTGRIRNWGCNGI